MSDRPLRLLCVATALFGLIASNAFAAAIHWNNPAGGNWNDPINWSPETVPAETDSAVLDLAGTYTVTLDVDVVLAGLRVSGSPEGVQTLSATGRAMTFTGPVSLGEQGAATWTSCTIGGTGAITNLGLLTLSASTLAQELSNHGTLVVNLPSTLGGTLTTAAGSSIRVEGGSGGTAILTVTTGFTNNGAITLTTTDPLRTATLKVNSGTLNNAEGGSISVLPGAGGTMLRNLNVALDNQGVVTVGHPLTISKTSAAHFNSGTIDLAGGDLTVLLSGTGPSFATSGTINVPAGRRLTLQSSAGTKPFDYNGGTMGGAGAITLTSALLRLNSALGTSMAHLGGTGSTISGPAALTIEAGTAIALSGSTLSAQTLVESGATLDLENGSVTQALTNFGTFVARGTTTASGALVAGPGSTLRVEGGAAASATLTAASGFTNSGTIELASTDASHSATLVVNSGTLVNAAGAHLNSLPGAGGTLPRYLTAEIDNRGTIAVSHPMSINRSSVAHVSSGTIDLSGADLTVLLGGSSPSFTTSGPINLPAGRTLTFQGSVSGGVGQNFFYAGGSVAGGGTIALLNATLNLSVEFRTSMARLVTTGSLISGPGPLTIGPGPSPAFTTTTVAAPVAVDPGATLEVLGGGVSLATLTTAVGSTVRVKGGAAGSAQLTVANGFVNRGTIELTSDLATSGATLQVTSGNLVNEAGASINTLPGAGGATARGLAAGLDNRGTVNVGHATYIFRDSASQVNTGTINLTTGNLGVWLGGDGVNPTFTTSGTINVTAGRTLTLGSVGGSAKPNFYYNGGTLGGAGTISLDGTTLYLNAGLGTASAHLKGSSCSVSGPGTLTIQSGTTAPFTRSSFVAPIVVEPGGTLECSDLVSVSGPLATAPGAVIRVKGGTDDARLAFMGDFTNRGTIELTSTSTYYSARLEVSGVGKVTNAVGASIIALPGAGGTFARRLVTALENRGTITVAHPLSLDKVREVSRNRGTIIVEAGKTLTLAGGSFTNDPGGVLEGNGTIAIATGTAFAQNGTVRPGSSCGTLTINGPCAASATSVYDVEIGGEDGSSCHDRLVVRDAATLAGTLNISVAEGYRPQPGMRYVIADFGSRTGTFSTVGGLAYRPDTTWTLAYSDTDVVLMAMDQTWARAIPQGSPPAARDGHAAVYDPTADRMILFGGATDDGVRNDVWVLAAATESDPASPAWIALAPTGTPPAPRSNASAVYDPAGNRMIVYGGDDGAATPSVLGDTWVLTNANGMGGAPAWIALAPASTPPSRTAAAVAYDRANNRLMVFGGDATPGVCGGALADSWVLENANGLGGAPDWTPLSPGGIPPSARSHHGAAYDDATGRLIVTGGDDGCGTPNMETWLLDGANGLGSPPAWSRLAPVVPAPGDWSLARYTYDASYGRVDGFGGMLDGAFADSTYTLTGANGDGIVSWYRRTTSRERPASRAYHSMVLNPSNHTAVVFGGLSAGGRLSDTWRHLQNVGPVLAVEPPVGAAVKRTGFALAPSPNPARGAVAMAVDVAREQRVDLGVFDIAGRRVATLHSGLLGPGRHPFTWSGGRAAAPGIYLVHLSAEDLEQTMRIVRLD